MEGRRGQMKARVVEDRDKAAHEQKAEREALAQRGGAQMHRQVARQAAQRQRLRTEVTRRRQQPREQRGRHQAHHGNAAHRKLPAAQVGQTTRQQAPGQAAERVAADVEAHRGRQRGRVEFFTHVGHRDRRQPAERHADERSQHQQHGPRIDEGAGQAEHARQPQCDQHHRLATPGFGQRPGDEHAQRQAQRGERQRQAAVGRRLVEVPCKQRQQRLHAVDRREGRQPGAEDRECRASVGGRSALQVVGGIGCGQGRSRNEKGLREATHFHSISGLSAGGEPITSCRRAPCRRHP